MSFPAPISTAPDLSHHLSTEARLRKPNPMKAIWKLTRRKPNMVSLANGDPHFSLYPIRKIQWEMASVAEEDPVASWRAGPSAPAQTLVSAAYEPCALPLQAGLQYSHGAGLPDAQRAVTDITNFYHAPPDHVCTLTLGNSDGITKCFRLLGEPGDTFIADEFAFSSVTNAPIAQGIRWQGVKMDDGGMIPEDLERVLQNWDPARGRRPHVMYLVPCGQNPTGSTLSLERRQRIYAIAQRYDLIIIEDDPYYFLQYADPSAPSTPPEHPFVRSFLSLDTDGRVLRIDSFSKIMAPGMRLGWITSAPLFHAALVDYTDSSTMHPHGFGQMLLAELLYAPSSGSSPAGWTLSGLDRWLRALRNEYHRRRARFLTLFERELGHTGLANARAPDAGMFVWIRVNVERHPRFHRRAADDDDWEARGNGSGGGNNRAVRNQCRRASDAAEEDGDDGWEARGNGSGGGNNRAGGKQYHRASNAAAKVDCDDDWEVRGNGSGGGNNRAGRNQSRCASDTKDESDDGWEVRGNGSGGGNNGAVGDETRSAPDAAEEEKQKARQQRRTNVSELMEEAFERCLDAGLVIMPASIFALPVDPKDEDKARGGDEDEDPVEDRVNYFRATFSGTEEAMEQGLVILGQVLREFFADAEVAKTPEEEK